MQHIFINYLFVLALITTTLVSHAGVYKCVDTSGKVSFQEKVCPTSSSSSEITLKIHKQAKDKVSVNDVSSEEELTESTINLVEINTASKTDLIHVVGSEIASQIIIERNNGQFRGWPDVVRRIVGLSSAQTAAIASINGLTVNGRSLDGVPPDAAMAKMLKNRHR